MTTYEFATIDPRPFALEGELKKLAAMGCTLGAEVTVPALAAALTEGNIDPQHSGGDAATAAIEVAVTWSLPPAKTTIVTVRPDADAFGTMAVLALREEGVVIDGSLAERVAAIAADDKTSAEWKPSDDLETVTSLQAVKAMCFDHRRSVDERVALVRAYLETGTFPDIEAVSDRIRTERREHLAVVSEVRLVGGIAVVESTSRFAVTAAYGYSDSDIVVAVNPAFRFQGGDAHRKVTVCQARPGLADLKAVFTALSTIEPGWGGSPTIGGSPQGVSSVIPTDDIVRVVCKHLL